MQDTECINVSINLFSAILKWEWYCDPIMVKAMVTFIALCQKERDVKFRNIPLKDGQFVTTLADLSKLLDVSKQQIRTIIERMEKSKNIRSTTKNGHYTVIEILGDFLAPTSQTTSQTTQFFQCQSKNYDFYQQANQQAKQQATVKNAQSNKPNNKPNNTILSLTVNDLELLPTSQTTSQTTSNENFKKKEKQERKESTKENKEIKEIKKLKESIINTKEKPDFAPKSDGVDNNGTTDGSFQLSSQSAEDLESNQKQKQKRKLFVRPTPEEVQEYCNSRNNGINGQSFCDFYDSKGWMIGRNPMKDWKACVRTWERSNFRNAYSSQQQTETPVIESNIEVNERLYREAMKQYESKPTAV